MGWVRDEREMVKPEPVQPADAAPFPDLGVFPNAAVVAAQKAEPDARRQHVVFAKLRACPNVVREIHVGNQPFPLGQPDDLPTG